MKESIHFRIYLAALISIASLANADFNNECGGRPDPYPCNCAKEKGPCDEVLCNCVTESEQLRNSLKLLRNISKLFIMTSRIKPLRSDAFRGPKITRINIGYSQIPMESPQFLGQESSLNEVYVARCFDEENPMNRWDLGHLRQLCLLQIYFNNIPTLKNDWLTRPSQSLKTLRLYGNGIRLIEDRVFEKLTELEHLELYMNQITSISRSMFPRPAKLRILTLHQNEIEYLPDDIFEDMSNLEYVSLYENHIKTLRESTLAPLFRIGIIPYITDNPFRCDESLKWITTVGLKHYPKAEEYMGECEEPNRLKGKSLAKLKWEDFV